MTVKPFRWTFVLIALLIAPRAEAQNSGLIDYPANPLLLTNQGRAHSWTLKNRADPRWQLAGEMPSEQGIVESSDKIGEYKQLVGHLKKDGIPLTASVRLYENRPIAVYSLTYDAPAEKPILDFPDFTSLPPAFHIMSYRDEVFTPVEFKPLRSGSPWVIFNDSGQTFIVSPASHFMIQTIGGDGKTHISSQLRPELRGIPKGFTQQTMVAYGDGINKAWDAWGQAMTDLQGKARPSEYADLPLSCLGYWTDNGSFYYYHYDRSLGYAGTLLALEKHFLRQSIPVRYLQLDSWWYYKSLTDPKGKKGTPKSSKLPEGEWNRYGGLLEYKAHPAVFPEGLAAFQRELGLPLITHNRWIDPSSPYHRQFKISGFAAVDPAWWRQIMAYINSSGVVTYEQDWLSEISAHSPEISSSVDAGDLFLDGMANSAAEKNMTLQYCMGLPSDFMQGSKYANLTTIRTSDDRLKRERWHNFLYASRFASALGIWPWTDTYRTPETGNMLLATLSAGMVGFGDEMGKEDAENIFRAVRADGVIVKPDVPLLPVDSSYIAEANQRKEPLVSFTYSDHSGLRTAYVLAFHVPPTPEKTKPGATRPSAPQSVARADSLEDTVPIPTASERPFTLNPAEAGISGKAVLWDFQTGAVRAVDGTQPITGQLADDGFAYYIIAPVGKSGIAFLGDPHKFASCGSARIASIDDAKGQMTVAVVFAPGEQEIALHGCCDIEPLIAAQNGSATAVNFDRASHHFNFTVRPPLILSANETAESLRVVTVALKTQ
jgi:hypothetical protein